jgi:hypothetical protein
MLKPQTPQATCQWYAASKCEPAAVISLPSHLPSVAAMHPWESTFLFVFKRPRKLKPWPMFSGISRLEGELWGMWHEIDAREEDTASKEQQPQQPARVNSRAGLLAKSRGLAASPDSSIPVQNTQLPCFLPILITRTVAKRHCYCYSVCWFLSTPVVTGTLSPCQKPLSLQDTRVLLELSFKPNCPDPRQLSQALRITEHKKGWECHKDEMITL